MGLLLLFRKFYKCLFDISAMVSEEDILNVDYNQVEQAVVPVGTDGRPLTLEESWGDQRRAPYLAELPAVNRIEDGGFNVHGYSPGDVSKSNGEISVRGYIERCRQGGEKLSIRAIRSLAGRRLSNDDIASMIGEILDEDQVCLLVPKGAVRDSILQHQKV